MAEPFKHADALKAAQTDSARIDQVMADAEKPEVRERGAGFRSLTEVLDTTGPMAPLC